MFEIMFTEKGVVLVAKSKKKKNIKSKNIKKKTTNNKIKNVNKKVKKVENTKIKTNNKKEVEINNEKEIENIKVETTNNDEEIIIKLKSSEKNVIRQHPALEDFKIKTSDKNVIAKIEKTQPSSKLKLKIIPRKKSISTNKELKDKDLKDVVLKNKNKSHSISVEHPKVKNNINVFEEDDVIKNKEWAIVAYLFAPLVYLFRIDSKYVLYHAKRGMSIFIIELISLILYNISKDLIKINVSCANYATFSFTEGCKANPWWLTFSWGIITLVIIIVVTKCIAGVLREKVTPEENVNFN